MLFCKFLFFYGFCLHRFFLHFSRSTPKGPPPRRRFLTFFDFVLDIFVCCFVLFLVCCFLHHPDPRKTFPRAPQDPPRLPETPPRPSQHPPRPPKTCQRAFQNFPGCPESRPRRRGRRSPVYPLLLPGPSDPRPDPLTPPKDLKTSPSPSPTLLASKGLLFHAFNGPIYRCAFPLGPNKSHAFPT